jgi:hypothetical protein
MASALFAPIGVSFTLCDVRHIYNFQFDLISRPGKNSEDLLSQYWVGKRINMFFPGTITDIIPGVCGFASLGGVTYNGQVGIVISKTLCPYTVSHELGHYFSLEHTFETSHGLELVNGSNCATAGDSICDTPADPYVTGSSYVNSNCTFTFTGKDTNGDYYDPDVSNIMSYYPDICACKFTHQQYEKMAKYFLSNPIEW